MATNTINTYHTLIELAKRHDPKKNTAELIDILSKENPFIEEAHWEEANDLTSHTFTQIIAEPSGEFTQINKGVKFASGRTKQVNERIAMLESASCVDLRLLKKSRDKEKYIADENRMHVRGMGKTFHASVIYDNAAIDPDRINGFFTRYPNLGSNVISNGATTGSTHTSILVIKWGRDGVYFVYPRGSKGFIEEDGPKEELIQPDAGEGYRAQVTMFKIEFGVCIADPRNYQRICNIATEGTSHNFDHKPLIKALNNLTSRENAVIYVNKDIKTQMDIAMVDKTNVNYTMKEAYGRPMLHFQGVPVKECEGILSAESQVT